MAVALLVVGAIRWAGPAIYDGDGWYHVKYAQVLRDDGISRAFPWFQESFLKERFTDFNLLYHLVLIPFVSIDPLTGARVASVVFAAATLAIFWGTARALRVPYPALWPIGLLALAPEFTYRLTYTRPLVLAIGLAIGGTGAILLGKRRLAFALAFVYAHWHCSYHLLPCVALLHDVLQDERRRFRGFSMTLWTTAGAVAGSVLTPYFPNNLGMWWVANVEVLRASWSMGDALRVGSEMLAVAPEQLLFANLGVFLVFGGAVLAIGYRRRASDEAQTLLAISASFLVLSFLSQRFVELWAPFAFLLAGVTFRDAREAGIAEPSRAARIGAVVLVAATLPHTLVSLRAAAAAEEPPAYLAASAWMKEHVPPGETIFNMGWDEFPQLFFADGSHPYIIGQDATFMWVTDAERTRLWTRIPTGKVDDLHAAIRRTFRSRWVFVPRRYVTFTRLTRRDPRFRPVWADAEATVLRLDDDGTTFSSWSAGERRSPGIDGFVDLERLVETACATVRTSLEAPAEGNAVLGLTTDDPVTVRVNGVAAYTGPAGGPPVPLDAVFAGTAGFVPEREVPVVLRAGPNEIEVEACHHGDDFGFVMRRAAR